MPVAQLDRALASEAKGCRFDSRRAHYKQDKDLRRILLTLKRGSVAELLAEQCGLCFV